MTKKSKQQEIKLLDLYPLPETWEWVTVKDAGAPEKNAIVDGPFGSNLKVSDYVENGPVPVLTTKNLNGSIEGIRYISQDKFEELIRSAVYPGDILMAKIGSCGKTGIYPQGRPLAMIPANLLKVTLNENFFLKYVFYYFNTSYFQNQLKTITKATAQPAFGVTNFRKLPLPFAPKNEQSRIVAEIEKQFSRLDEAVENLKRVKTNLKRYKASVLKAAVEGKLTVEWRKKHPDVEPADKLLERILSERRKKWEEAELARLRERAARRQAKMKVKDKEPKDDKWKKKYKEPYKPDLSDLPKVPTTWKWGTFDQVSTRVTVGHVGPMKNEYKDSGIPFLRSQNVRENKFSPIGLKYINRSFHKKLQKSSLQPGDIVVVRSGSVGIASVIPLTLSESNCSDLVIIKQPFAVLPEYGSYYMNSIIKTRVASEKVGVALTHFNTKSVAAMPIPVPPLDEQVRIVADVEKRLSIIDGIEIEVEQNLFRSDRLRQSILKKAFSGNLVAQDENDEFMVTISKKFKVNYGCIC